MGIGSEARRESAGQHNRICTTKFSFFNLKSGRKPVSTKIDYGIQDSAEEWLNKCIVERQPRFERALAKFIWSSCYILSD